MNDPHDIDAIFSGLTKIAQTNGMGFVADKDSMDIGLMREHERQTNTAIGCRLFFSVFKTWNEKDMKAWQRITELAGEGACTVWDDEAHFVPEKEGFVIRARWGVFYLKKAGV